MMRFLPEKAESRREFFRATARYGLLTMLTAAAAFAARKTFFSKETCVNRGICSACGVFERCGLPQALSARASKVKRDA
jgi:hypothetical protein